MAHRLPATSLHVSLDECKTWGTNVPVDSVGGAYPSMVTLKDGSILIVYYEEGHGSSIRAKALPCDAAGDRVVDARKTGALTHGGEWRSNSELGPTKRKEKTDDQTGHASQPDVGEAAFGWRCELFQIEPG
jgi:hypothetical protein